MNGSLAKEIMPTSLHHSLLNFKLKIFTKIQPSKPLMNRHCCFEEAWTCCKAVNKDITEAAN